ncbi:hypothetical protein MferCBS49748_007011 [Microsporum ferrugineum]
MNLAYPQPDTDMSLLPGVNSDEIIITTETWVDNSTDIIDTAILIAPDPIPIMCLTKVNGLQIFTRMICYRAIALLGWMFYLRVASPYLPVLDHLDYPTEQHPDIVDICDARMPDLFVRFPPEYGYADNA